MFQTWQRQTTLMSIFLGYSLFFLLKPDTRYYHITITSPSDQYLNYLVASPLLNVNVSYIFSLTCLFTAAHNCVNAIHLYKSMTPTVKYRALEYCSVVLLMVAIAIEAGLRDFYTIFLLSTLIIIILDYNSMEEDMCAKNSTPYVGWGRPSVKVILPFLAYWSVVLVENIRKEGNFINLAITHSDSNIIYSETRLSMDQFNTSVLGSGGELSSYSGSGSGYIDIDHNLIKLRNTATNSLKLDVSYVLDIEEP